MSERDRRDEPSAPEDGSTERDGALEPGWSRPRPAVVPPPTYWPAALALAITLMLAGVVTSPWLSAVGLLLAALSIGAWIGDIRKERRDEEGATE